MFPSYGLITRRPASLPRVPDGASSPASAVLSGRYDFLPPFSPHFVSFAWRYHSSARVSPAPRPSATAGGSPGVGHPVPPAGNSSVETAGSPPFLGNPLCSCPALRPRQDRRIRPTRCVGAAPAMSTAKAPAWQLSWLNHTASALAVYASQAGSPRHHARLASGCWPSSSGRDCLPAGFQQKVSRCILHLSLLFQVLVAQGHH